MTNVQGPMLGSAIPGESPAQIQAGEQVSLAVGR